MSSKAPESIGRYQVVKELKSGGMGTVFLGRDPRIGRHMGGRFVAIKVLQEFEDQELRARFDREADIAGTLDHRNIVQIYDNGEYDGRPFIVMEYVDGKTMREMIETRDVPLVRRLEWMEALCDGLACAHRAGVVHRDIKPDNVIIRTQDGVLKILDFGIARANTIKANMTRGLLGTLNYMAPEQWEATASVDARADMFASGAVFYELLSGRKAFPGGDVPSIYRQISMLAPEPLEKRQPNLDADLIAVVNRCLEKLPADRYADMDAVRADLAAIRLRLASRDEALTIVRPARTFVNEAQRALETGAFELALEACAKALESEPANTTAREIEGRARAALQMQNWLLEARGACGRGSLTEASRLVDQVLGLDEKHPEALSIRQEIDTARHQFQLVHQVEEARTRAIAALDADQLDAARAALAELVQLDRDHAELPALNARLGAAIERRRAIEEDQRARQLVTAAQTQFIAGQYEAALAMLAAHQPPHAAVTAVLAELRSEHQEIERRRVAEQRARRTIDEADRRIRAGDRAGALAFLESHQPAHPDVTAAIVALGAQIADLERRQNEARRNAEQEQERKRLEAERALEARRKGEQEQERKRVEAERALEARRNAEQERRAEEERRRKAEEDRRRQAEEDKRRKQDRDRLRVQPDLEQTIVTPIGPQPPAPAPKSFDWRIPAAAAVVIVAIGIGVALKFRSGSSDAAPEVAGEPTRRPEAPPPPPPAASTATAEPPASAPVSAPVEASKVAAATPPTTTPPPSAAAVDRQVTILISTAQQQWTRDDRDGAMSSLAAASKLKPGDAEISRVSRGFIRTMSDRAANAAAEARNAGAPDVPGSPFAAARRRQQEATQLERTAKPEESVRAYGDALELFAKAIVSGRLGGGRGPTTPPPPTGTTAAGGGATSPTVPTGRSSGPPVIADPPPPTLTVTAPPPTPPTAATTTASANAASAPASATAVTEDAVRQTIQRYQAAYESLNARAANAVNPKIDVRQLDETFKQYTSLKYDIKIERVEIRPDGQTALASGTLSSMPAVKTGRPTMTTRKAVFQLRKTGDAWLIQDISFK